MPNLILTPENAVKHFVMMGLLDALSGASPAAAAEMVTKKVVAVFDEPAMTTKEAARFLGVSESAVEKWAVKGEIPSKKVKGRRVFNAYELAILKSSRCHLREEDKK